MNKKLIRNYQIFSLIFTFILGTLLHFTFELSGENIFVAIFSAVNESVWEHLKLLFFPMLLTTIIDISSFFVIASIGEFIAYLLIVNKYKCNKKISVFVLSIIFLSFVIFTFFTPKLNIFNDPISGNYGINSKNY